MQHPLHTWKSDGFILGIITARKRSLLHGNVFTPVCHSVHWGGGWLPSMYHRSYDWGCLPPGGVGLDRAPPPIHGTLRDTVNKRMVCILLECILLENVDFVKLNILLVNINTEVLVGYLKISDHCLWVNRHWSIMEISVDLLAGSGLNFAPDILLPVTKSTLVQTRTRTELNKQHNSTHAQWTLICEDLRMKFFSVSTCS